MKMPIDREWFEKRAAAEGDHEIGAGGNRKTMTLNLTDDEIEQLQKLIDDRRGVLVPAPSQHEMQNRIREITLDEAILAVKNSALGAATSACAVRAIEALKSATPSQRLEGWQDISTAPKNTKVLAAYRNEHGKWRIVTACYHTELPWSDEYGDLEEEYAPEGWYEESDSSEVIYQTSSQPTHWQPLPAPPATAAEGSSNG